MKRDAADMEKIVGLSGESLDDIADYIKWLIDDTSGLDVEALDATIAELKSGKSLAEGKWRAICEWDL